VRQDEILSFAFKQIIMAASRGEIAYECGFPELKTISILPCAARQGHTNGRAEKSLGAERLVRRTSKGKQIPGYTRCSPQAIRSSKPPTAGCLRAAKGLKGVRLSPYHTSPSKNTRFCQFEHLKVFQAQTSVRRKEASRRQ
jgi:hypothetical protein